tara:strand:- start:40 stop:507 length:468 start_codon:yes stop_codon:yes gene_type:complete
MLQIQNASSTEFVIQYIYVTCADVQTIAQANVYYLIELTSLGSLNSLYFIPYSVVANNGRYTKMTFIVAPWTIIPIPESGKITFYDNLGRFNAYPMGFYTYKIYEQTSSTNLDPTLSTLQLEEGMAYVRDHIGNMEEVTPDFNEYTPTTEQFIHP